MTKQASVKITRKLSKVTTPATIAEMARMDFTPIQADPDRVQEVLRAQAAVIGIAFGVMGKTREELIERIANDEEGLIMPDFVKQLINTQKWLKDTVTLLNNAECRIMCAASAVEKTSKKAA